MLLRLWLWAPGAREVQSMPLRIFCPECWMLEHLTSIWSPFGWKLPPVAEIYIPLPPPRPSSNTLSLAHEPCSSEKLQGKKEKRHKAHAVREGKVEPWLKSDMGWRCVEQVPTCSSSFIFLYILDTFPHLLSLVQTVLSKIQFPFFDFVVYVG